ncbi:MAG: hypothetical protein H0X14_04265 [Acidobacteria bacterium]|nr:hypothetical protein [Acidobacteriota bacterium]
MNTNVNLEAALGVMAFLGGCFALLVAGLIFIHALTRGKGKRARLISLAAALGVAIYLGLVLAFSFASDEKRLASGEEKYFCEIDCHLAYSVIDLRKTKAFGVAPNQLTARGIYYLVTIKTRFDEKTISRGRGDAPLTPNSRTVTVRDEQGREYSPSLEGQRVLELSKEGGTPLNTPLRPGESYTTTLIFDLPTDISNPVLLLNEGEWMTHLIIGHENSPLHKKTMFLLEPQTRRVQSSGALRVSPAQTQTAVCAEVLYWLLVDKRPVHEFAKTWLSPRRF